MRVISLVKEMFKSEKYPFSKNLDFYINLRQYASLRRIAIVRELDINETGHYEKLVNLLGLELYREYKVNSQLYNGSSPFVINNLESEISLLDLFKMTDLIDENDRLFREQTRSVFELLVLMYIKLFYPDSY